MKLYYDHYLDKLLLFRASEHQFKAAKFHQVCDNIPDTVTIVRTEFGKTIAAYTPLKWTSLNNQPVADPSRRSFLLQLDLREKMTLIQGQEGKAIYDHPNWGPTFGGGGDICIANSCN
jgi:hypothetical protein